MFVCVSVHMYFSLPIGRYTMLSDFGLMFFISDVISVTNEILAVEKIASKPMSSLKMTSVPAVHLDCKVVGRFPGGL